MISHLYMQCKPYLHIKSAPDEMMYRLHFINAH